MSENFIEIQNLEKVYQNGAKAVYDFNLDIKKKEFIVIVGPSGCGKSTTLRMIAGLEDITSGNLLVDGELINYKLSKDRNMAIVFQSYALYPQMNVFENIAFPLRINQYRFPKVDRKLLALKQAVTVLEKNENIAIVKNCHNKKQIGLDPVTFLRKSFEIIDEAASILAKIDFNKVNDLEVFNFVNDQIALFKTQIEKQEADNNEKGIIVNEKCELLNDKNEVIYEYRKMSKSEVDDKVNKTADVLDLGDYLDRLPKQLSGGQMQRVALGRAIVKDVPIFLMDEPLSNLDAKLRLTMRSEIVKLHQKINATTIYVTHDQTEAMTMADRIVVMSKGFIQQIDVPSVIYNDPCNLFVAKFIGAPSINLLKGNFVNNKITLGEDVSFKIDAKMAADIQSFYQNKNKEFNTQLDNFDKNDEAKIFILKVLSANSKDISSGNKSTKKKGFFKKLFKKTEQYSIEEDKDYIELKQMTETLDKYAQNPSDLILGIRPEKLDLVPASGKNNKGYIIEPDVIELLGDEYVIHFTFLGNDMVAKLSAKTVIDKSQKFVLNFSEDNFLIFDPVTGERIK